MKKPVIVGIAGLLLVFILFYVFDTAPSKKLIKTSEKLTEQPFDITKFIDSTKTTLAPRQSLSLGALENNISRGDVRSQQIISYTSLANFWKDSLKLFEPYAFYISKACLLDKSEKNLTFAAQIFLNNLRWENNEAKLKWETAQAISLFEEALKLNPENDDLKIGLGSSYILGRGRSGNPEETMKGIQVLLGVIRKDSANMKAQLVLGMGGYISGQYDKAIERLHKVVASQPENVEAIAFLADSYAAKNENQQAIKWYNISKRLVNDPHYSKEVDARIKMLK